MVVGVVGVNIELTSSQKIVTEIKPYETGHAVLYANDGTIVSHPDPERIGEKFQAYIAQNFCAEGVKDIENSIQTGIPVLTSNKTDIIQTYPFRIGETDIDWVVVSTVPIKSVMAAVSTLTNFTIILILVSLVVAMTVIFFVANSIVKPIFKVAYYKEVCL